MLSGALLLAVLFVLAFGGLIGWYWWQIHSGKGDDLAKKFAPTAAALPPEDAATTARRLKLETKDDPFFGSAGAKITIVEFIDYKCPVCKEQWPVMEKIIQKYGSKVKIIVRDFPVEYLHPGANQLSLLAACAQEQGLFLPAYNWLFANQETLPASLTSADIGSIAADTGLNAGKLETCINSVAANTEVNQDYATGVEAGAIGTPTYFINGYQTAGNISWEAWNKFLENL